MVFIGMGATVIPVVLGPAVPGTQREREPLLTVVPILACLAVVLVLGVYIPGWLDHALHAAASFVEMQS